MNSILIILLIVLLLGGGGYGFSSGNRFLDGTTGICAVILILLFATGHL